MAPKLAVVWIIISAGSEPRTSDLPQFFPRRCASVIVYIIQRYMITFAQRGRPDRRILLADTAKIRLDLIAADFQASITWYNVQRFIQNLKKTDVHSVPQLATGSADVRERRQQGSSVARCTKAH